MLFRVSLKGGCQQNQKFFFSPLAVTSQLVRFTT